jgi:RNA polymerase sigma-70 factor (ECF subfamily)
VFISSGDERDEAALADRARAGDLEAYATLVRAYLRTAFAVAYGILRQVEDAEDLVQDAFLKALQRLDRLRPGSPFGPWFYRLVTNEALNRRRWRARRETVPLPEAETASGADPERDAERSALRRRLGALLDRLPPVQAAVVIMHDVQGYAHAEIATALGIPEGTSRSHLHHARKRLREWLTDGRPDER